MPPSTKYYTPRRSRGSHATGCCAARAITRLLSACLDRVRTLVADLLGRDAEQDQGERPYVATLGALDALGWHVVEIPPSVDAPVLWRVRIERYDGSVAIVVLDAADPDAALEELARYAAADAAADLP